MKPGRGAQGAADLRGGPGDDVTERRRVKRMKKSACMMGEHEASYIVAESDVLWRYTRFGGARPRRDTLGNSRMWRESGSSAADAINILQQKQDLLVLSYPQIYSRPQWD